MKSTFIVASLAAAALATPLEKRWMHTTWDITTETVTVTGSEPTATDSGSRGGWWGGWRHSSESAAPTPTTTEAPAAPASSPAETKAPAPSYGGGEWSSTPASSAAAPAGTTTVSSDYAQGILDSHNNHRANASVPALTWSDDLASIANTIGNSCKYAHDTSAGGGGYGQNIGAGAEPSAIPGMITNQMYNDEINYYPGYGGEPDMGNFEKWGHYSQIVWKSTTEVGCATVHCPNGLANTGGGVSPYFTVCNYKPAGNFGGQYGANVLKPQGMPTITL